MSLLVGMRQVRGDTGLSLVQPFIRSGSRWKDDLIAGEIRGVNAETILPARQRGREILPKHCAHWLPDPMTESKTKAETQDLRQHIPVATGEHQHWHPGRVSHYSLQRVEEPQAQDSVLTEGK